MLTRAGSRRSTSNLGLAGVLIAAVAIMAAAVPAGRVRGFTEIDVLGTVGTLSLPPIYVEDVIDVCAPGFDRDLGYAPSVCPHQFTLEGSSGPILGRSQADAGDQIVQAVYILEMWDSPEWVVIASSGILQGWIAASQAGYRFVTPRLQSLRSARGYFRFSWLFSWHTSGGALLGSTTVISDLVDDHVCVTRVRWCQSHAGFVQTGGYLTGGW